MVLGMMVPLSDLPMLHSYTNAFYGELRDIESCLLAGGICRMNKLF